MVDLFTAFSNNLNKEAENRKPVKEIDQTVLYIKAMGLRSPHFKDIRDEKACVSETFLNQMMQAAYTYGARHIDETSYSRGYDTAMKEVAEKLGMVYE